MSSRKRSLRPLSVQRRRQRPVRPLLENLEVRLALAQGLGSDLVSYPLVDGGTALMLASKATATKPLANLISFGSIKGDGAGQTIGSFEERYRPGFVNTSIKGDPGDGISIASVPGPDATLTASNVPVAPGYGQTSYDFTVAYAGAAYITRTSLAGAVVQVVPPSGLGGPITATVVSTVANGPTDSSGNSQFFTVTYSITPPHGSWTSADNGTYTVDLGGSPVSDTNGDTIPSGSLGTFDVETASIRINKFGLSHNPRTGLWSGSITLTNTGTSAFSGPIYIQFNLPGGVFLENATGTYGGQFYLQFQVASLAAGATTSAITVTFNSNVAPASYSTSFYLGFLGS